MMAWPRSEIDNRRSTMRCGVRLTADIEKSDTSVHMPIDATMFIVVPMMMEMIMEEAK